MKWLRAGAYPSAAGHDRSSGALKRRRLYAIRDIKKIYVLRVENGKQEKYPFNYKEALSGKSDQNILLKAGDTIVVP